MTTPPDILAFDPGVTVGICLLHHARSLLETLTLPWDRLDLDRAYRLRETYSSVSDVVIEKGPRWGVNHRMEIQSVEEVLAQVFPDAHWIQPSQWKGTPQARDAELPKGISQHERDVARMAIWFYETRERRVAS